MFEPFFTTKEPGRGTGLGLATTYAVISNLGGHIDVVTAPGMGTTFRTYLPVPRPSRAAASIETLSGEHALAARGSETVLLVEDEESVRQSMCG